MREVLNIAIAAVVVLLFAPHAAASYDPALDLTVDLGAFSLIPDDEPITYSVSTVDSSAVGFSFAGRFSDPQDVGMWASDTVLRVYHNDTLVLDLGGYLLPKNEWDFQGSQSSLDGIYAHGIGGDAWTGDGEPDWSLSGLGQNGLNVWRFEFSNGWESDFAGPINWSKASLTIHMIPAPPAAALLVAALIGVRRRY